MVFKVGPRGWGLLRFGGQGLAFGGPGLADEPGVGVAVRHGLSGSLKSLLGIGIGTGDVLVGGSVLLGAGAHPVQRSNDVPNKSALRRKSSRTGLKQ